MKAAQITELNKPYSIKTVPVPTDLGPCELLVKVAVASYCHTDGMVSSGVFGSKLPLIGSHEGAGTVVAAGSSVASFRSGDRVMCGLPLHPCGECAECNGPENQTQYCTKVKGHVGVHIDGCFAEYVRVDSRTTTPLPAAVSFLNAAPLACAGRTAWRAVLQAGLAKGQWLAMVGSGGGLGHFAVQFAKAKGFKVIGIDARDEGLSLSREKGADAVLDARRGKEAVAKEARELAGGKGADATIVFSDADSAAALGCAVTKMHGTVVEVAQPEEIKIPFQELIMRDIRLKGSVLCSAGESQEMVDFVAEHSVSAATVQFDGLDLVNGMVELAHSGKLRGKAVVIVDQEQLDREKSEAV